MINVLYRLMRLSYEKLYGEQQMLHYPLYKDGTENLLQGQTHLTDYCLSHLRNLDEKRLLDIGCGNGIQTLYIGEKYRPQYLYGIDLNPMHVDLAKQEGQRRGLSQIDFGVDNAQSLTSVADSSFDAAICIESSHHYPDKYAFLSQMKRVLRPGGQFVIADLIRKDDREPSRLEGKLYLFHWHPQRYRDALSQLKMAMLKDEDITDSILPAFRSTEHWLDKPAGVSDNAHRVGRVLGQVLIALYKLQLERYFRYHLLVGRRD
jgi:cyclopropane fatty-acyl-phospholipid synthase-like methyltransferase